MFGFIKSEEKIREIVKSELVNSKFRIENMQKMEIKEGDIVAVFYEGLISKEMKDNLSKALKEVFDDLSLKIHPIIFEDGMRIGILHKSE
jgi:hypothetical protein